MKIRTKLWLAGSLVATAALLAWAFAPRPVPVETALVTQGRFELAVEEDGKTRLRDRYVISAPLSGTLSRVQLKQGDVVEEGALLTVLRPNPPALLDARAEEAQRARVGETQALLQRAEVEVQRAQTAARQARSDWLRMERLAAQDYVSPARVESERLAARLAETALRGAERQREAAAHAAREAQAGLRHFQPEVHGSAPRQVDIRAPIAGRVLRVVQESEGSVQPGTPLLELGDPSRLEVVAAILTTEAAPLAPGAEVQLSGWGGPALQGRLRSVEPGAFTKVSALGVEEQRVNALIDIVSPPQAWRTLGDGFHLDVRILRQAAEGVVKLPTSAVFNAQGRSEVYVVEAGRARRKAVEIAARNAEEVWVRAGIAPGERVIVYPSEAVADGKQVRVR